MRILLTDEGGKDVKQSGRIIATVILIMVFIFFTNSSAYAQENQNSAQFPGCVVIPQGTTISIDDDAGTVTITDCPADLAEGDTFVVYLQDLPIAYDAETVVVQGDKTIVSARKADKSVYSQVYEKGTVVLTSDIYDFIPADGVTYSIEGKGSPSYNILDKLKYEDGKLTVIVGKDENSATSKSLGKPFDRRKLRVVVWRVGKNNIESWQFCDFAKLKLTLG